MLVLKFGGSSVSSAPAIKRTISIIRSKLGNDPVIVVVSAMGGITDLLLESCRLAAAGDEGFREKLAEIEKRHIAAVQELMPIQHQSGLLSRVKSACNDLEDTCESIYQLTEITPRTSDRILRFGETLSSRIVAETMEATGSGVNWLPAGELIITNDNFGNAQANMDKTTERVK